MIEAEEKTIEFIPRIVVISTEEPIFKVGQRVRLVDGEAVEKVTERYRWEEEFAGNSRWVYRTDTNFGSPRSQWIDEKLLREVD